MIHNPDDSGIDGWLHGMNGITRFLAADEEDLLPNAGADDIDNHQRPPGRFSLRRQRLNQKQLGAR